MTKMVLKVFQTITCTLGVTYNVNVRHTKSVSMVVSLAVYKIFFIKLIQEFIAIVGGGILHIC